MELTVQQIAASFSTGDFEKAYPHFSDNITWDVVGENSFTGKKAVMENCQQVAAYFKTVTSNFTTAHIISDNNRVAINGTAEFLRDGQRVAFVWACDVYEFNEQGLLEKITSYCIQEKN